MRNVVTGAGGWIACAGILAAEALDRHLAHAGVLDPSSLVHIARNCTKWRFSESWETAAIERRFPLICLVFRNGSEGVMIEIPTYGGRPEPIRIHADGGAGIPSCQAVVREFYRTLVTLGT